MTLQDTAELSDHHERARLIPREQRASLDHQQQRQQQQLIVSDEAAHVEQRADRMEQIEVGGGGWGVKAPLQVCYPYYIYTWLH